MKALLFERNLPRYGLSRVASAIAGSGRGVSIGPLRLAEVEEPALPGPGWHALTTRLSGICGSDLSTLDGVCSRYFEDIVSFPFIPGHEIVAEIAGAHPGSTGATGGRRPAPTSSKSSPVRSHTSLGSPKSAPSGNEAVFATGTRVVVEPVLTCAVRGIEPACTFCAAGDTGCCISLTSGHISPGLQTGYCADTGGGWGRTLVAHASQLHPVPDSFSDEDAVMVEPAACGVHAALSPDLSGDETVAIVGAGTLGLSTLAALRRWRTPATVVVGAKHPVQSEWAAEMGADLVVEPGELLRAVRRVTGTCARTPHRLAGGADVVFDCVGSAASMATSLSLVRPRGDVVMVGMGGPARMDLAPLWQREIRLTGAYAYGAERNIRGKPGTGVLDTGGPTDSEPGSGDHGSRKPTDSEPGRGDARTFDLAFELVGSVRLGRLVSAVYPLERAVEAVTHAADAGRRGAVKIAFDPRRKG